MTVDLVEELTKILVQWDLLLNDRIGRAALDTLLTDEQASADSVKKAFEALDAELCRLEEQLEQVEDSV